MRGVPRWLAVLSVVAFAGLVCAFSLRHVRASGWLRCELPTARIPADGVTTAEIKLHSTAAIRDLRVESEAPRRIAVDSVAVYADQATTTLRAGVMPGTTYLRITADGLPEQKIEVATVLDPSDSFDDGTPDFLRLHGAADRTAFRGWFTLLAESQYFRGTKLPREIDDCASLLRFSYREALRQHDSAWASEMALPSPPRAGEVSQYHYPYTPLAGAMFRVRDGAFVADDLDDGAFAEFADAKTLWRENTYSVGRSLAPARPGDLLFFRQPGNPPSFHAMIFLGRSQIEPGPERYVVYHTGPEGKWRGEMRRLTVAELMNFPDARWRPVASNPAFLGVYRWNILRGDE